MRKKAKVLSAKEKNREFALFLSLGVDVCMYVCMYVLFYVCMYLRMYVCGDVNMWGCMYSMFSIWGCTYVSGDVCMYAGTCECTV